MEGQHGVDSIGESVVILTPITSIQTTLGDDASRLVAALCWRVLRAVRCEFGETRPLFLAGAMLTRNTAVRTLDWAGYDYGAPHVDRANISSYDYSAVLYLNTQSRGFAGGDFAFVDEGGDEVIEPRAGRCLLFTAGFEHLHRVGAVTKGNRFVLASWFTLSATAGDALQPAHYE
mmetsp:Transcript_3459/g.7527  ORF Transcript_3459/g.7527 Transcript_3459/m.7527 type:complete len:175 (+) Transcript_3459:1361-1885(+)